jgi:hypothetical protein
MLSKPLNAYDPAGAPGARPSGVDPSVELVPLCAFACPMKQSTHNAAMTERRGAIINTLQQPLIVTLMVISRDVR